MRECRSYACRWEGMRYTGGREMGEECESAREGIDRRDDDDAIRGTTSKGSREGGSGGYGGVMRIWCVYMCMVWSRGN